MLLWPPASTRKPDFWPFVPFPCRLAPPEKGRKTSKARRLGNFYFKRVRFLPGSLTSSFLTRDRYETILPVRYVFTTMKRFVLALVAGGLLVSPAAAQTGNQRPKRGADDIPRQGSLRVGEFAPDFTLKMKEGNRDVKLSSFKGRRPVVLVFGSYT